VVAAAHADSVRAAAEALEQEAILVAAKRHSSEVLRRWARLTNGLLVRQRLQQQYGMDATDGQSAVTTTTASK
jgi:hypothetical protein